MVGEVIQIGVRIMILKITIMLLLLLRMKVILLMAELETNSFSEQYFHLVSYKELKNGKTKTKKTLTFILSI